MKSHSITPMKDSLKGQIQASLDLSEPTNLLRFCTFVTIGAIASSLVIGACWGRLDFILVSLSIAGVISLIFWVISLLAVTLILTPKIALGLFRRLARKSSANRRTGGGVTDKWLDGPS